MNATNVNESFARSSGNFANLSLSRSLVLVSSVWQLIPILTLVFLLTAFVLNALLLGLIIKNSHLQTPFANYIINLLVANLINQLYQQVLEVVANVRTFANLGPAFCAAYLYGTYVIHGAVYNSHFLIALNRVWAVTFPITYRQYHTKRVSIIACCLLWVYVHATSLPGFIGNELYHTSPLEAGCFIENQPIWTIFDQTVVFDVPLAALFLAYPVICVCEMARSVKRRRRVAQGLGNREIRQGTDAGLSRARERIDSEPTLVERRMETTGTPREWKRSRKSWAPFILLTLLTLSNLIFLAPLVLIYNLAIFANILTSPRLMDVGVMLLYVQAVTDPILFTFALKDLRQAFLVRYRCTGW